MKVKLQQSSSRQVQLMLNHSNHPTDPGSGRGIILIVSQLTVLTAVQSVELASVLSEAQSMLTKRTIRMSFD